MKKSNYQIIIEQNLKTLFSGDPQERAGAMAAHWDGRFLTFDAFGAPCRMTPDGLFLNDRIETGPIGIIISLYALNAVGQESRLEPFKAFKEIPDSMPYAGAFASHAEQILVPNVERILKCRQTISDRLHGLEAPAHMGGDDALVVHPLPKIALCYIFYVSDEDFPASTTCLYSNNADAFMPVDGLADVGEYTSRAILNLIG